MGVYRRILRSLKVRTNQADNFLTPEYLNQRIIVEAQHSYEQFKSVHARLAKLEALKPADAPKPHHHKEG